jgi:hypothetical protein
MHNNRPLKNICLMVLFHYSNFEDINKPAFSRKEEKSLIYSD